MKFLVLLAFSFNFVYSTTSPQLSVVSLPKYPEVKRVGDDLTFDFEFEVTKDVTSKTYSGVSSPKVSLLLLPPLGLKFHSEASALKKKEAVLSTLRETPNSVAQAASPLKDFTGECSADDGFKLLSDLHRDDVVNFGAYKKYSVYKEYLAVPKQQFLVEIDVKGGELKKGTYTWSGKFEKRSDLELPFTPDTLGEFVVALSVGKASSPNSDLPCFARSKLAASFMLRGIEEMGKHVVSCGTFGSVLPVYTDFQTPRSHNLALKASLTPSEKDSQDVELKFTLKDASALNTALGFVDIVIDLPKGLALDDFEANYCSSAETKERFYCRYDKQKGTLSYSVLKSSIKLDSENTIKINVPSVSDKSHLLSKTLDFSLSLLSKVELPVVKEVDYETLKKASGYTKIYCSQALTKLNKEHMKHRYASVVLAKASASVQLKDVVLAYKVKKVGSDYHMKIFLQDYLSFNTKKFFIKIEPATPKDFNFSEPKSTGSELLSHAAKKGIKYEDALSVEVDFRKMNKPLMTDKFFVVNVPFSSNAGLSKLSDPSKLKFTVEDEDKVQIVPLRKVALTPESSTGLQEFEGTRVKLAGPFFTEDKKVARLAFNMEIEKNEKMLIHLGFKNLKGVKNISGFLTESYDQMKVESDKSKFIQFSFKPLKATTHQTAVVVVFELEESSKFSADSVVFSVVENPVTEESFDVAKEKSVLLKEEIDFTKIHDNSSDFAPCITEDTRFSSSQFRSGETANYFFTRLVDCKRPWLPAAAHNKDSDLEVAVAPSNGVTPIITLHETMSFLTEYPKLATKLISNFRFYEHIVYILIDQKAMETIKAQMIESKECTKSDTTCPDNYFNPTLRKYTSTLFKPDLPVFINGVVAYYDSKDLDMYLAKSGKRTVFTALYTKKSVSSFESALELTLDYAFSNSRHEFMGSSFSVIVVTDSANSDKLKSTLTKYEPSKLSTGNGSVKHSVYVDILPISDKPVSKTSKKEESGELYSLSVDAMVDADSIEKHGFETDSDESVYTGYKFKALESSPSALPTAEESKLKGTLEPTLKPIIDTPVKREDYSVFFGFRPALPTSSSVDKENYHPLKEFLESAIKSAFYHAGPYHVIGTCSSFFSEKNSRNPHKYTLSFRGVTLGEYTITAKTEILEKLYAECDLFSLYKFIPHTQFNFKAPKYPPTLPDPVKDVKVVDGVHTLTSDSPQSVKKEEPSAKKTETQEKKVPEEETKDHKESTEETKKEDKDKAPQVKTQENKFSPTALI